MQQEKHQSKHNKTSNPTKRKHKYLVYKIQKEHAEGKTTVNMQQNHKQPKQKQSTYTKYKTQKGHAE